MGGGETKRTESRAWAAVRPNMEDLWKTTMHAPVSLKRKTWPDFATKNATSIPPFPFFSPSLISLMVSVDVKHQVYLLDHDLPRQSLGGLFNRGTFLVSCLFRQLQQLCTMPCGETTCLLPALADSGLSSPQPSSTLHAHLRRSQTGYPSVVISFPRIGRSRRERGLANTVAAATAALRSH